jgi:hypothetical protein
LIVGDYEIPEAALRYVRLSIGPYPVSFGGMVGGDDAQELMRTLKLLAEQSALQYEAEDMEGVSSSGICNLIHVKFERSTTQPGMIRFSAQLAHPFIT